MRGTGAQPRGFERIPATRTLGLDCDTRVVQGWDWKPTQPLRTRAELAGGSAAALRTSINKEASNPTWHAAAISPCAPEPLAAQFDFHCCSAARPLPFSLPISRTLSLIPPPLFLSLVSIGPISLFVFACSSASFSAVPPNTPAARPRGSIPSANKDQGLKSKQNRVGSWRQVMRAPRATTRPR